MRPLRIVGLIVGSLISLVGLALMVGAAVLGALLITERDDDGFFSTSTERFATPSYALTSQQIDLTTDPGPARWWADRDLATVRVSAENAGPGGVFVGIGPEADVEAYLADVPHVEVVDVDFRPFSVDYREENAAGTRVPVLPQSQPFWVATATGVATQSLSWDVEPGRWALVVMNADATPTVTADIEIAGRIEYLAQIALGLGLGGIVLLASGVAMILAGTHRPTSPLRESAPQPPHISTESSPPSPVRVEGTIDPNLSRWQWLVKWFLAIPHFIVLAFLWVAFVVLTIVAFFAILFTGRYPRRIFDFNVGVLRWSWRVSYYATSILATDQYPPFSLHDAVYPATLQIEYPERLSRGLVLVKSWLLAIPHLVIIGLLTSSGWPGVLAGGLLGALVAIAAIGLLFTGRHPRGVFDLLIGFHRWIFRVVAYVALMTDVYPPFRLDQGGTEPRPAITPLTTAWPAPIVHESSNQ